jgi:predicted amidohydrolase
MPTVEAPEVPASEVPAEAVVGLAQWLAVPGQPELNEATAAQAVRELAARGASVVVLPELWVCGYDPRTLAADARAAAEPLSGPRLSRLAALARETGVLLCAGSLPEAEGDRVYNTAVLLDTDGNLVLSHRKAHLYPAGGEPEAFSAGSRLATVWTRELGQVGMLVCFDGDFPESARTLALAGAGVVLLPCAYETAAATWWDILYPANALANGQWWLMANQHGDNGGLELLGGSQIVGPDGSVHAAAPRGPATVGSTSPGSTSFGSASVSSVSLGSASLGSASFGSASVGAAAAGECSYVVYRLPLRESLRQARADSGPLLSCRRPELYAR